jgi:hypothetical protein
MLEKIIDVIQAAILVAIGLASVFIIVPAIGILGLVIFPIIVIVWLIGEYRASKQ